jgi:hypothetical protein
MSERKRPKLKLKTEVIEAALLTKGISPSLPGYPKVVDSWQNGDDLFIQLASQLIRVEISALPAELIERGLLERPIPEATTLKAPEPETLRKKSKKK